MLPGESFRSALVYDEVARLLLVAESASKPSLTLAAVDYCKAEQTLPTTWYGATTADYGGI